MSVCARPIQFIPDLRIDSVPLFLKRQRDRTLPGSAPSAVSYPIWHAHVGYPVLGIEHVANCPGPEKSRLGQVPCAPI